MPRPDGGSVTAAALILAGALAGCASVPPPVAPRAPAAPVTSAPPQARPAPAAPVSELAAFYARIEGERRARGLMRTDDGRGNGPVAPARLAAIWAAVALNDEHGASGRPAPAPLRRFERPVAIAVEFGASVPAATRAADRVQLQALVADIADAARHPVALLPEGSGAANFHVLVLSQTELAGIGPRLEALVPGIDAATVQLVEGLPRDTFCLALSFARAGGAELTEAVAIIRAEHPDLTRLACYHEEIAQGLGLSADSPAARPSIFNDDQEFALLTHLDRLLLRLHHDPRLAPGMTARQAEPIALVIASALAAGES